MTQDAPDAPGTGPDGSDVEVVTSEMLTASRLLVAVAARSLAGVAERVTLPQFRMLVVLAGRGEMRLGTLAERLGVNPSTAMRMVNRLVAADLTSRDTDPGDRRATVLRVTDAGRRIVDEVTARRRAEIETIVGRMPSDHRAGMVEALRAFNVAGREPDTGVPAAGSAPLGWE